ncbi:MAG: hypothetical protein QOI78_4387 [Actinomycetota bacterium]|nr:hypothetical protein [Actinomycetota bacterium]
MPRAIAAPGRDGTFSPTMTAPANESGGQPHDDTDPQSG